MVVPLLAAPDRYRAVLASFAAPFLGARPSLAAVAAPEVRLALGGGLAALTVAALAAGRAGSDRRGWRLDAAETLLLWAYFAVVPPVLAVGAYFSLWHSVRHAARYALLDGDGDADPDGGANPHAGPGVVRGETAADRSGVVPALARFARDAAPTTAAAFALLAALAALVPAPPTTVAGWVALYLVLVAVLTLPHAVVVTWLDRRQGVWTPASRRPRGTANGNR
jgi:Brp/Blh family beta-carotene 15,15'-monooxygenase